jgi:hypothetical protein
LAWGIFRRTSIEGEETRSREADRYFSGLLKRETARKGKS